MNVQVNLTPEEAAVMCIKECANKLDIDPYNVTVKVKSDYSTTQIGANNKIALIKFLRTIINDCNNGSYDMSANRIADAKEYVERYFNWQ